ncbi:MAG: hypothetical protein PHW76_02660 [Alphaproteobacteria bacterium]|nr:hypothetical protein [Alphaproteobacteria bacterium]
MISTSLQSDDPLTREELTSITAIIEYLAFKKGSHIENTYCHLATEFKVPDVKQIKRCDYDRAVKYLVDLDELEVN